MSKEVEHVHMYAVDVTFWQGTGVRPRLCITKDLTVATLIKEALQRVYPERLAMESGNKAMAVRVEVHITPLFRRDVAEYVDEAIGYWIQRPKGE